MQIHQQDIYLIESLKVNATWSTADSADMRVWTGSNKYFHIGGFKMKEIQLSQSRKKKNSNG